MKWNFNDEQAIYLQIVKQMQIFIVSGELKAGERLPSVRELAENAKVNPNTMQKALAQLEQMNLVYANRTSGRFITEDENMILAIKKNSAKTQIENFFSNMEKIGFDRSETISMLEERKTENE